VIGKAMLVTSAISTIRPMKVKRVCDFMIPPEPMIFSILGMRNRFSQARFPL
jgi:hypothetical protein